MGLLRRPTVSMSSWPARGTPIAGLYQTGSIAHPGGSISGGPGRNAAAVMLKDFGRSLDELVANKKANAPAQAAALAK
jgi:phytoene dehydrogenase-like protein